MQGDKNMEKKKKACASCAPFKTTLLNILNKYQNQNRLWSLKETGCNLLPQ